MPHGSADPQLGLSLKGIKRTTPSLQDVFIVEWTTLLQFISPPVRACGGTSSHPCPQRVQGARVTPHWSRRIQLDRIAPGLDGGRRPVEVYSLSLCEMNRTVLCNTALSSATLGFLCPAPAAWKTVWGKIFQSIHRFSIKNTDTESRVHKGSEALRSPAFQGDNRGLEAIVDLGLKTLISYSS